MARGGVAMSRVSVEYQTIEDEVERRRSERTELIVRVDYSTVDELFSEFTSDINEGGLFIETESPRPAGTEVALRFSLPGRDEAVETVGRVVRVVTGEDAGPAGMGIEFEALSDESSRAINELIRSLRASHQPH
jgi:uncharacterized protein (TIGR02266 family)